MKFTYVTHVRTFVWLQKWRECVEKTLSREKHRYMSFRYLGFVSFERVFPYRCKLSARYAVPCPTNQHRIWNLISSTYPHFFVIATSDSLHLSSRCHNRNHQFVKITTKGCGSTSICNQKNELIPGKWYASDEIKTLRFPRNNLFCKV